MYGECYLARRKEEGTSISTRRRVVCAWGAKLIMPDDECDSICRPARNAATLNPISISALSSSSVVGTNVSTSSATTTPQTKEQHQHCFLLQGGCPSLSTNLSWQFLHKQKNNTSIVFYCGVDDLPFRLTYNDNYVLKLMTTSTSM
jgi:hypothetical protein